MPGGLQRALARFHEQASQLDGFRAGLSEREPTDEEVSAVNSRMLPLNGASCTLLG
jgi:hypothetical protein